MRLRLLILIAVALAVVAAWQRWPAAGPSANPAPQPAQDQGSMDIIDFMQTVPTSPFWRVRRRPPALVQNGDPGDATLARIRGRCVAAEDARPLAGCTVLAEANDSVQVVTGSDGVFDLHVAPGRFASPRLQVGAADRVQRRGALLPLEPGSCQDLGDILLQRGKAVHGVLVDGAGRGVGGVTVAVWGVDDGLQSAPSERGWVKAETGDDGRFAFESPLPPGDLELELGQWVGEWRLLKRRCLPTRVHVDAAEPTAPLRLVDQPIAQIAGVVVDERDRPVPGVMLATEAGNQARSDRHGHFWLQNLQAEASPARLRVLDTGQWEPDDEVHPLPWGSADARIVLRCGIDVPLEVVDDGGAPVERFKVFFAPASILQSTGFSRSIGHAAYAPRSPGSFTVHDVRRGPNYVQVFPEDEELAPSAQIVSTVSEGMAPLRVVLQRMTPRPLTVTDVDGRPVAGAWVLLVRASELSRWECDMVTVTLRSEFQWNDREKWYGGVAQRLSVSEGSTDARGQLSLPCPPSMAGHFLVVTQTGFAPWVMPDPQWPAAGLTVHMQDACTVAGRVQLDGQDARRFALQLLRADGSEVAINSSGRLTPEADGSFRFENLEPGDYRVRLVRRLEGADASEAAGVAVEGGEVAVHAAADQRPSVTLQAPQPQFGAVRGRLSVSGQPASHWRVECERDDGCGRRGSFTTGSDGSFVADRLLPGRYHLAVRAPDHAPGMPAAILAETFEVGVGAASSRDFDFVRRRLVLHVRRDDGLPVSRLFELRIGRRACLWPYGKDIVLDPAPELPVSAGLFLAGSTWSEPVTMPQDKLEYEVEVVVPLHWR